MHDLGYLALGNFGLCTTAGCTVRVTQGLTDDKRQPSDPSCSANAPLRPLSALISSFRQIECCETADEFYGTMGRLTQEMLENDLLQSHELMQVSSSHGWEAKEWVDGLLRPDLGEVHQAVLQLSFYTGPESVIL